MTSPSPVERRPAPRRELFVATGVIALLLAFPLFVPRLRILFVKPLWLDELHTWLLARELPGPQLADHLARGADFNPPLLYVVDSAMLRLLPWLPVQVVLRLTSVLALGLSLVLLYRLTRRRLDVLPAAIGTAAVLANSVLLGQVHEARFYAPWFALAVGVAFAMEGVVEHPRSWARWLVLALLSAATCLIHYFGIISLACLGLGLLVHERSLARIWRAAAAMALGSLALVAWWPVYAAQRHVLHVATWVPHPTLRSSTVFILLFVAWVPYAIVFAAAAAMAWRQPARRAEIVRPSSGQAALIGLVAMPFVLVVFSWVVQPTLLGRYALPAIAGMATLVAMASALLPRRLQQLALAGMLVSYVGLLGWKTRVAERFRAGAYAGLAAVNGVAADPIPVLSQERATMYTAALSAASRNPNLRYLVAPLDTIRAQLRERNNEDLVNITIVEQDGAVAHRDVFGFPAIVTLDEMRRMPAFYFLLYEESGVPIMPALFDGFSACRVGGRLMRFSSSPGATHTRESLDKAPPCPAEMGATSAISPASAPAAR